MSGANLLNPLVLRGEHTGYSKTFYADDNPSLAKIVPNAISQLMRVFIPAQHLDVSRINDQRPISKIPLRNLFH
jgi:hypothetical protein